MQLFWMYKAPQAFWRIFTRVHCLFSYHLPLSFLPKQKPAFHKKSWKASSSKWRPERCTEAADAKAHSEREFSLWLQKLQGFDAQSTADVIEEMLQSHNLGDLMCVAQATRYKIGCRRYRVIFFLGNYHVFPYCCTDFWAFFHLKWLEK